MAVLLLATYPCDNMSMSLTFLTALSKGQHDIDLDEVVDLLVVEVLNLDSTDLEVVDLLVVEVLDAAEFLHLGLLDVLNLNHSTFLESFLYGASL